MLESFKNNPNCLEIHDGCEMACQLLRFRSEQDKSQRQLGRALGLTLEQVVEMEKRYEMVPVGTILQPMLALYGASLRVSRDYEPPPGAQLYQAMYENHPEVRGDMDAVSRYLQDAPLQSILQELKDYKFRIWLKINEYGPLTYKLFRVKTQEGRSSTVSVDSRLVRKALWSLAGGKSVAEVVRERALTFDEAGQAESRSRYVQRGLLEAIDAADRLFEGQNLH